MSKYRNKVKVPTYVTHLGQWGRAPRCRHPTGVLPSKLQTIFSGCRMLGWIIMSIFRYQLWVRKRERTAKKLICGRLQMSLSWDTVASTLRPKGHITVQGLICRGYQHPAFRPKAPTDPPPKQTVLTASLVLLKNVTQMYSNWVIWPFAYIQYKSCFIRKHWTCGRWV